MNDPFNTMLFEQSRSDNLRTSLARESNDAAQSRARVERERASSEKSRAQLSSPSPAQVSSLKNQIAQEQARTASVQAELDASRRMLTEWRHSHEAMRRMMRKLAGDLSLSDEARQQLFDETVLDVAEEDPTFSNTDVLAKAKARSAIRA